MSDGAPPTVTSVTSVTSSGAMAWRKVYDNLFSRYLLLTNTVVSGVLEGLGDFLQQKLEGKQNNDWQRTKRMTIMGLILGPPEHYWFRLLDKRFPGKSPRVVAKKVFLDETVNGVFFLAVFFIGMSKLNGHSWKESFGNFKEKFWQTYKMELLVWPAAQAINFYLIPPSFRVIYTNLVYLGWCMFLSHVQHKDIHHKEKGKSENT